MRKLVSPAAAASVFSLAVMAAAAGGVSMAEPGLSMGSPAPALATGKWIKGDPVEKLAKGRIYAIVFWASWSAPSRESIPLLSDLHKKFKDVVFIGQNCFEKDDSQALAFVEEMGDKITFRVALDDKDQDEKGWMARTWMTGAGRTNLPCVFVVDKETVIAWIGQPGALGKVLEKVVAGNFDVKTEREAAEKERRERLTNALQEGDVDAALAVIDEILASGSGKGRELAFLKFNLLLRKNDTAHASALGWQLMETLKDNPEALNELAWIIVNPARSLKNPDLELAEKAAARASEMFKNENAAVLDTLARVMFMKGDLAKAIELQTRAVEKCPDRRGKAELQLTLEEYQDRKQESEEKNAQKGRP